MAKILALILLFAASARARADEPAAPLADPPAKVHVILIEGWGSNDTDVQCWTKSAKSQSDYGGYTFKAIKYPAATGKTADALASGQGVIRNVLNEISSHPDLHYILVGHSSGSTIAEAIAKRVSMPKQIEFISLEGNRPSEALEQRGVKTLCVYGSRPGFRSRGAGAMKACANHLAITDPRTSDSACTTPYCLHMSLVNTKAPAVLNSDAQVAANGYRGCTANLAYLPKLETPQPPTQMAVDPPPAAPAPAAR